MREFCAPLMSTRPQPRHKRPGGSAAGLIRAVDPADGAWALRPVARQTTASVLLTGSACRKRPAASALPEWMFDDCHGSGRTVA